MTARVMVAMSGGVDSSVAAARLVEQGYEVVGATMKLFCYGDEVPDRPCCSLDSISDAYYASDASRNVFVGCLFAVSAFLLAYNGFSRKEMIASKIASGAAFLVAMFPCVCDRQVDVSVHVHGTAAAAMFLILAYLCFVFRQRATAKGYPQAKARAISGMPLSIRSSTAAWLYSW